MQLNVETSSQAFRLGFKKTLHFQGGVIPFGALFATLAVNAGLQWWMIMMMSIVIFGGSSQLVFIDLYRLLGSPFQAVIGSNIINARHLIYSAGVTHEFSQFTLKWRLLLSYLLTDQLFAVSVANREDIAHLSKDLRAQFYFGSGFCTWIFWQISTGLGIGFGKLIPESWNMAFAIPLMFMPILFGVCKTKFAYFTVVFAMVCVFFFHDFPYGLGVFCSILAASLAGYFVQVNREAK